MSRIDINKPIRAKASQKRLYVTWQEWNGPDQGLFWVYSRSVKTRIGFRYSRSGVPHDPNPWGDIENCEEESPFEDVFEVTPQDAYSPEKIEAKRKAEHEAMVDAMGNNDVWGSF